MVVAFLLNQYLFNNYLNELHEPPSLSSVIGPPVFNIDTYTFGLLRNDMA